MRCGAVRLFHFSRRPRVAKSDYDMKRYELLGVMDERRAVFGKGTPSLLTEQRFPETSSILSSRTGTRVERCIISLMPGDPRDILVWLCFSEISGSIFQKLERK